MFRKALEFVEDDVCSIFCFYNTLKLSKNIVSLSSDNKKSHVSEVAYARGERQIDHVLEILDDPLLGDAERVGDFDGRERSHVPVRDDVVRVVRFGVNGIFRRRDNLEGKFIVPEIFYTPCTN